MALLASNQGASPSSFSTSFSANFDALPSDPRLWITFRASRAIKVQGHRGTLRITGTTQGEAISVYTTGGTLVAQESAEGDETLITLPTGNLPYRTVMLSVKC